MSEEDKQIPSSEETPEIQVPTPAASEDSDADIVASKPDVKERPSAVIGTVDRPTPPPASGNRFRGGQRGGQRGPGGQRGGQRGPGGQRGRFGGQQQEEEESGLFEKVVHINRCAKVVAGGRRFSFSALVVVGDQQGNVGVGYGKAKEVPECIRKGTEQARKNMKPVAIKNNTIPHDVLGEHDGGRILLRPAVPGTGVIAGGGVRAVLEAAGIKDVLTKSLRSNNPGAMVFATLAALKQLRTREMIESVRKA
jgi:small subunit ribosomal protein S5